MDQSIDDGAVSRRRLITGAAAAAALGGVAAAATTSGAAGASFPILPVAGPHPEVLGNAVAGLTYLTIDGFDFQLDTNYGANTRYATDADGVFLANGGELAANLPLPTGSVIRQINIVYRGSPIINLFRRTFAAPRTPGQYISKSLDAAPGLFGSTTVNLDTPITVDPASTVTLRFYLSPGSSIFGVTIGYSAPLQGFVPFTGADPRVLDTRLVGGKLGAGEDRAVSFASFGSAGARAALFNLAVVETEGAGGFVGCFSGATWPGNSNLNWFGVNQILSNSVTCALDSTGQLKLHGGANKTHVVVDVVGYLY